MARWAPGYDEGGRGATRGSTRELRPTGTDEVAVQAQAGEVHEAPGLGRLDHGAGADIHGYVIAATGSVEEEVPGLKVTERYRGGVRHLRPREVRERDAGLAPGPGGQSRAVEADSGGLATPDVGHPDLAFRRGHCTGTAGGDRWGIGGGRIHGGSATATATATARRRGCGRGLSGGEFRRAGLSCLRGFERGLLLDQGGDLAVLLGQRIRLFLHHLLVLGHGGLLGGHGGL